MTRPVGQPPLPNRRWAVWLGAFLIIPLAAASCGLLLGLYRQAVTGQLTTVAKSYGATSKTIIFSENPAWFLMFFSLHAVVTALVILVTVVVAKLVVRRMRLRQ